MEKHKITINNNISLTAKTKKTINISVCVSVPRVCVRERRVVNDDKEEMYTTKNKK